MGELEFLDYPRLRTDLQQLPDHPDEPPGGVLYDPARRVLFELDAADLPVLALLDGSRTAQEIARQAGRPCDEVVDLIDDLFDMMLLQDPEQAELLDELRQAHEFADDLLQPALNSAPLAEAAGRPLHVVQDARHSCVRCGACCHYAVPVSAEDRRQLEEVDWPAEVVPEESGRLFQVRPGLQWGRLEETIATRSDPTRCAFLDEENLCRVHRALGYGAKPFPCRLFPLAYPVVGPGRVWVSLTFECPYLYCTYETGEHLAGRTNELRALLAEMEEVYFLPEGVPVDGLRALPLAGYLAWEGVLLQGVDAVATAPGRFLERLQAHWARISPLPGPLPEGEALAGIFQRLARAARANRAVLADSPEGKEGTVWAGQVLQALSERPAQAWPLLSWENGPAADRFLAHFVRHFVEGKQHLFYRSLRTGLGALSLLLLLARADAGMSARAAGQAEVPLALLNRALSRWCRLLDVRPLRLALLRGQ